MSQHTDGAWAYDPESGDIFVDDGGTQALVATVNFENCSEAQALADGRVLAAAPDLLEAVKSLLQIIRDALQDDNLDARTDAGAILCGDVCTDAVHEAQVAIAKASPASLSSVETREERTALKAAEGSANG